MSMSYQRLSDYVVDTPCILHLNPKSTARPLAQDPQMADYGNMSHQTTSHQLCALKSHFKAAVSLPNEYERNHPLLLKRRLCLVGEQRGY